MKTKKWDKWKLVLFVPLVFAAVQAFAQAELIIKTNDSIPENTRKTRTKSGSRNGLPKILERDFFNLNWNRVMFPKNKTMF
jgi:hypothetical protein